MQVLFSQCIIPVAKAASLQLLFGNNVENVLKRFVKFNTYTYQGNGCKICIEYKIYYVDIIIKSGIHCLARLRSYLRKI